MRAIQTDVSVQQALEQEFERLRDDRETIRSIFPSGDNKVIIIIKTSIIYDYIIMIYNYCVLTEVE